MRDRMGGSLGHRSSAERCSSADWSLAAAIEVAEAPRTQDRTMMCPDTAMRDRGADLKRHPPNTLQRRVQSGAVARAVPAFMGRARELASLDSLLDGVREGRSGCVVLRGEAGIGKTALVRYCARQASGCRVAQIAGVESELEMPFAAVHQLCAPMLNHLDSLPTPQREALEIAFGVASGNPPDCFVVGLAVLSLLAETAAKHPLVVLVDDAQWIDEPSRQVLGFVGRRLLAEAVLLVLAVKEHGDERLLPALPTLTLDGLTGDDARALLTAVVPGQLDDHVRDRIVDETRGNPLRLIELPREMTPAELAGGFGAPHPSASSRPLEERYVERIRALPEQTQRLMLVAAADPTGDPTLLWRTAQALEIGRGAAVAAESEGLLEIGQYVRFRHPLIRSAAYAAGTAEDRSAAHAALAAATDSHADSERRVWHLAAAATGPDEAVALQLEAAAVAAQTRAGLAAAAAFLERSMQLTSDVARLAERALAAAQAHMHAGAFGPALRLLDEARAVAIDDVQRGRIERLSGQVQYRSNPGADAPALLLEAARALAPLDVQLARETYLDAWMASFAAGACARRGGLLPEVSRAARSAPPPPEVAPPWDLFLEGFAKVITEGRAAAAPSLRKAVTAFMGDDITDGDLVPWGHLATSAACMLWDWESLDILSRRHVASARNAGALAPLSMALNGRGVYAAWCGDLEASSALTAEYDAVNDAIGIGWYSACELLQSAYRGRPEALARMAASAADSAARGVGHGAQFANWARAILCNGLGRYVDARSAAELAAYGLDTPGVTGWALAELIEATVRSHEPDIARAALEHLTRHTLEDSDWAMGLEARCRALVNEGAEAEGWYVEAVGRLARTPLRPEQARAHLLYGEWLRRAGRRVDAREQLTIAHDLFVAMGAEGFSERARRELMATGQTVRKRSFDAAADNALTPQEAHVARLARDGRSNAEIGAELFLSVRTVEWHLRKVFQKLGVSSRRDLRDALPSRGQQPFAADLSATVRSPVAAI